MSPGTLCREKSGLCDLPEYCTGQSPFCPSNSYQIDGASCEGGKAYCYNGMCLTYKDQCLQLWGPGKDTTCSALYCSWNTQYDTISCCYSSVYGSSTLHIYSQWQSLRNYFSCLTHLENEAQISHAQTMSDKWQVSGWHRVRWLPGPAGISHMRVSLMQEHSQHQTLALRMSMLLEMSTGTVGRTSTATTGSVRKGRKHGSWELLSGDVFYMLQNYGPVDKNGPYFGFHPSLTPGKPAAS